MLVSVAGHALPESEGVIACCHCMEGHRVFGVFHDGDGDLQFSCELLEHDSEDWRLVHLGHLLRSHPDLRGLPSLNRGEAAERDTVDSDWRVARHPD